jgi:hypothetical protein
MRYETRHISRLFLLTAAAAVSVIGAFVVAPTASAQNTRAQAGTFDGINVEEGWVILGDQKLSVSQSITVTTASGSTAKLDSLAPGTRVGFTTAPNPKGGKPIVTKVWVLPKDEKSK